MKKMDAVFGVVRVPMDALAVFAALTLSFRFRQAQMDLVPGVQLLEPASTLPDFTYYLSTFVVPTMLLYLVLSAFNGLYTLKSTFSAWVEVGRILLTVLFWFTVIIAWYFLVLKQLFFSRILLIHSAMFVTLFVMLGRTALLLFQRSLLTAGYGRVMTASVGSQTLAAIAYHTLTHDEHYSYMGHVEALTDLAEALRTQPIDLVLHTDPHPTSEETIRLIEFCRSHHVGYGFLPPVLADVPHQLEIEHLGLLPLMRLQPTPLDGWGSVFKRLFDIIISFALIMVLSPLFLLLGLLVLMDSGWPIFYISKRIGQRGTKRVYTLKFRSMIKNADSQKADLLQKNHRTDGPLFKIRDDPRVTRFGKFLRRLSLDELPQLFNVLVGQMSLVGPRPHLPDEVERYSLEERRVFAVKPGITGLAQVSGRSDLPFKEEVRLDLQYIEEWSMRMDLWVLWRTFMVVMSRRGAD